MVVGVIEIGFVRRGFHCGLGEAVAGTDCERCGLDQMRSCPKEGAFRRRRPPKTKNRVGTVRLPLGLTTTLEAIPDYSLGNEGVARLSNRFGPSDISPTTSVTH